MKKYNTVEEYILGNERWQDCLILLREIMLSVSLQETIKWGGPVYTFREKNVAGMAGFKSYVGIWFYQGALLKDKNKKLISAEESTRALRQWRFNDIKEIEKAAGTIREYTLEAIENVRAGREIKPVKNKPIIIPPELEEAFKENPALRQSFESLNLTRKREYATFIGTAKLPETRQKRLEKSIPLIMQGTGITDKYL